LTNKTLTSPVLTTPSISNINAKGDILVGTADNTLGIITAGSNGDTLVADSSTSTGLRYQSPYSQQPVLNSAFQVWQRGTSFTATSGYTADRWYVNHAVAGRTVSRQVTNDTTNLPFIQYSLRYQRDSGNTNTANNVLYQSFESVNSIPFAGKTVTMSFYARAGANFSAASSRLGVYLISGTGTDQNYGVGYTGTAFPINNQTATLTTTWQRFTFTGTVAATATELTTYVESTPVGTAGANDWFEITGVQLELGSVATPFHTYAATLQGELAACQRYYWRTQNAGAYTSHGNGFAETTAIGAINLVYPITMRTAPSSIDFANVGVIDAGGITAVSSLSLIHVSALIAKVNAQTAGGLTTNRPYFLINNNNSAGYVGLSAEL
jgi:hypothetical protein